MSEYNYPCDNKEICHPVSVKLKQGLYKLELWGAQGGNVTGAEGGSGGYSSGILRVSTPIQLYLFIGASGYTPTTFGFTKNSFNGGGCGFFEAESRFAAPGGGATDIRTSTNIEDRIIVAGGGGGAGHYSTNNYNRGGYGGGITGGDGIDGQYYSSIYAKGGGGKNDTGGSSTVQKGITLYGGNQTNNYWNGAGGGGGYFGGGSGDRFGASGGGGSGFVKSIFMNPIIKGGNESAPNFYTNEFNSDGHKGDGAIRITEISYCSCGKQSEHFLNIFFFVSLYIS